ncbi:LOB domain-containing protein 22-like protein [Tanacetum coccineum]
MTTQSQQSQSQPATEEQICYGCDFLRVVCPPRCEFKIFFHPKSQYKEEAFKLLKDHKDVYKVHDKLKVLGIREKGLYIDSLMYEIYNREEYPVGGSLQKKDAEILTLNDHLKFYKKMADEALKVSDQAGKDIGSVSKKQKFFTDSLTGMPEDVASAETILQENLKQAEDAFKDLEASKKQETGAADMQVEDP